MDWFSCFFLGAPNTFVVVVVVVVNICSDTVRILQDQEKQAPLLFNSPQLPILIRSNHKAPSISQNHCSPRGTAIHLLQTYLLIVR